MIEDPGRDTYIYFIRGVHTGLVKIGISNEPYRRLIALQAANADTLQLLAMRRGDLGMEQAYHQRFAASRQKGEWFTSTPDLMTEIAFARTLVSLPNRPDVARLQDLDFYMHHVTSRLRDRPLIYAHEAQRFAWVGDGFWAGWEGF